MTEELQQALASLGNYKMSPDEREAQRLSFAYGNGSAKDSDTMETVKRAVELSQMS